MSVLHVVPCQDLIDHEDAGVDCVCGVDVEYVIGFGGRHGKIVIHHPLDDPEREECDCGPAD